MEKIDSHSKTIRELLAHSKYELDYYQREYSWGTKQIVELIDDLTNKFLSSYKKGDERTQILNYGHYFLGSIVICNKDSQRFIIDGQQRLTTLTLLLIRLHHLLEDEDQKSQVAPLIFSLRLGEKSFNMDISDREPIMEALYSGDQSFDDSNQPESVRNIAACYNAIEDYLPKELQEEALPYFVDWLLEKVYLVEITAYADDDAYTIFETMNDRGLSLAPSDMLRGYLLSKVTNIERRNKVSDVWRERVEDLKIIGKEEESDAIKAWLRSQYTRNINDFDEIGSKFHRWVREHEQDLGLQSSDDFSDFIGRNFEFYSRWYYRLREATRSLESGLECVYYNAQNNFTLQYPILLSPLSVEDTEDQILRKIRIGATYLDILIHRRIWNFQDISQRTMADRMFPVIPAIRGKSISELRSILYTRLEAETLPFANNSLFHLHGGNRRKIFLILARMTDYVRIQSRESSHYLQYMRAGKNSYEVEHIWANDPDAHREEFAHEFEFESYRNRIGGLLLLPRKSNASYGGSPYAEKHDHYLRENFLARSLHEKAYKNNPGFKQFIERSGLPFRSHFEFKKADLDARQKLYQLLAEQIWSPERLFEDAS